jgi:hypothetical protein
MSVTPNYNWPLIEPTDFVTNLPADFEAFADAVDETVKDLNPGTTAGDLDYYTSSTAKARLGIGTAGQVLTVNSGATAPEWASPAGSGSNWTLLNTGGTALTGAQTITVSGISNKDKIMILVDKASSANTASIISVRLNTDTGNNYYAYGNFINAASTYNATNNFLANTGNATSGVRIAILGSNAVDQVGAYFLLTGGASSGVKMFQYSGGVDAAGTGHYLYNGAGYYNSASTISSISIFSSSGNLDNGTVYVYTSA